MAQKNNPQPKPGQVPVTEAAKRGPIAEKVYDAVKRQTKGGK